MAYAFSWVIPSRVLLIELENEVTMDEMVLLVDETHAHVNSGRAPVHIMVDAAKLLNKPVNFQEINRIANLMPNMATGWWVIINPGKMMWLTASVLSRILRVKLKTVQHIEEALTILRRVDLTLETQPVLPLPN